MLRFVTTYKSLSCILFFFTLNVILDLTLVANELFTDLSNCSRIFMPRAGVICPYWNVNIQNLDILHNNNTLASVGPYYCLPTMRYLNHFVNALLKSIPQSRVSVQLIRHVGVKLRVSNVSMDAKREEKRRKARRKRLKGTDFDSGLRHQA